MRTLSNAFDLNRIHQAYLLSGVRGVGKTTTARIMARALNYHRPAQEGAAAIDAPTIRMPGLGTHCQAIIESRHVDVVEMDAASHTGIDDVRELIEGARYRPRHGAHQGLHHRRSPHAVEGCLQWFAEDPRRAAGPRQIPFRHDRDREGSSDGAVALSALRPPSGRGRRDDGPPEVDLRPGGRRRRRRGARGGRPGRRRVRARRAIAARSGHRPRCLRKPDHRAIPAFSPAACGPCWAWPIGLGWSTFSRP